MRREALKDRLKSSEENEADYLDLEQDIMLMRTIVLDYIDRYDELT